jgi:hypothetical protein
MLYLSEGTSGACGWGAPSERFLRLLIEAANALSHPPCPQSYAEVGMARVSVPVEASPLQGVGCAPFGELPLGCLVAL